MNNQTFKNDPADRSDEAISELEKQLRSIWQDFQSVVQTMLWDETAKGISDGELAEIEMEIEQIRELLDEYTE